MRAMVIPEFGDPDVFEERDLPIPEPGPGELRVRVHATSVNPLDCRVRREGDSMGLETPIVVGYDASGVVDAVGAGVESFETGDEVFYTPELFEPGCYAEYNVVSADIVADKPPQLSHEEAAAMPVVGATAWAALVDRGGLELGDRVLVHGAGGVGQQVVQVATAAGADVYATASPETLAQTEALGAERAIDYRSESFVDVVGEETEAGVDLVVDTVGGGTLEASMAVVRPGGRMVDIVGDPGDIGPQGKLNNVGVEFMALERTNEAITAVGRLLERGDIVPVLDSTYPLSDVAEAHERLEAGGITGKLVLTVE
jgi:NADPH:quinone reductase-like Zn-dependent oxidoreductase